MWVFPEVTTLGDIPAYHGRRTPEQVALLHDGRATSFGALEDMSSRLAGGFIASGLRPGDTIAFLGYNSDDYFVALFAAAKAGCPFLPLNWRLSAHELSEVIGHAAPSLLIVEQSFSPMVEEIAPTLRKRHAQVRFIGPASRLGSWIDLCEAVDLPRISADMTAMMLYTSGTTGKAKAVRIPHSAFSYMRLCEHLEPAFAWQPDERMLLALPNFHLFGNQLALQFLYNGLAVSIMRMFDPLELLDTIERDQSTTLVLVPAMIQLMLDHERAKGFDFSRVRTLIYSGSPISPALLQRAIDEVGCDFIQYYGATELNGAAMILRPDEHEPGNPERLKSCGRPLPLVEVRIVDPDGNDVPEGAIGEFVVRTPALTGGYHGAESETRSAYDNGWYRTGDAGYSDENGFYYICDRLKDMIVSGSENIYSVEIEKVLILHPAVKQVAVIGIPDHRWGEAVKACVVLEDGAPVSAKELERHARSMLAGYKVPKSFDFHPSLPVSPTGKILKHLLRQPYWASQLRSVG